MADRGPGKAGRPAVFLNPVVGFLMFVAAAGIGWHLWPVRPEVPLVWFPAGIGMGLLLIGGLAQVPLIFVALSVIRYLETGSAIEALVQGGAFVAWGCLVACFMRRPLGFTGNLHRSREVSAFLVGPVLLFPLLVSMTVLPATCLLQPGLCQDPLDLWMLRWLADSVGILVVTPYLLVWMNRESDHRSHGGVPEALLLAVTLTVFASLVFRHWAPVDVLGYPVELGLIPLACWASIRFGQRGATAAVLLVSLVAVRELSRAAGGGANPALTQPPVFVWGFVAILAVIALYLAALWAELGQREGEARMNEERLRAFVQALPDLALVLDQAGRCLEIFAPLNSQFRERSATFRGAELETIFPGGLSDSFREILREVIQNHELRIIRYALAIDGEDRFFEGRFAPIDAPGHEEPSIMLVCYDITESQRARQDLQNRDVLLKSLTEAEGHLLKERVFFRGVRKALDCVGKGLSMDLIQIYQTYSEAFDPSELQLAHEWLRENPPLLGPPLLSAKALAAVTPDWIDHLESGRAWEMYRSESNEETLRLLNQLGLQSLILLGIRPKGGGWGFIAYGSSLERHRHDPHAQAVLRSITDSLRAYMETQVIQEQLEGARQAAVAADQAKSEFLAIMSHEIRTPMNAIIGFSDLLRQTQLTGQQDEYLEIITRSGKDLLELINNILDFSKLESNTMEVERIRFCLETTVMEVLEMVLFRAKEKGIDLQYNGDPEASDTYWGDPMRIRQVLLNLLTNAIKFTDAGHVRLEILTLEQEDSWYTFEIRVLDTGIGIPEEHRGDLFKAFRQVDSSTTRQYGGTGLGLTIVQRLVDKMGGRVTLESTVGEGSTFIVVLRLERQQEGPVRIPGDSSGQQLHKGFADSHPLNILVVEDDKVNIRLVCEILSRLGYQAEAVNDGYKALAELVEGRHNVVLMDMQMSRLDGFEATRRIRKGECGHHVRDIPIIALTALALKEEKQRILDCGVDYYLSKPIRLPALKQILEAVSLRQLGAKKNRTPLESG